MDSQTLLKRPGKDLDRMFASAPAGAIPEGETRGTALLWTSEHGWWSRFVAWLARCFCWQGKVFDPRSRSLLNRVSFASVRAIRANVYQGTSWVDEKPCIVIDYSQTSQVARKVRDEIREIEPGLYLGVIWWGRKAIGHFALTRRHEARNIVARRAALLALAVTLVAAVVLGRRFTSDVRASLDRSDPDAIFKYGSTGGERDAGIPLALWKLLPELFPEHLPGVGLASLGFVFEPGRELPIGVSQRRVQGIERVFVNCAVCHCGTVRMTPEAPKQIVSGMPSNTVDLQGFQKFLTDCVLDERFTGDRIALEIEARESDDWINRQLIRYVAIDRMRSRILFLRDRFQFLEREPPCGPGRFDTFNPPKVLMNFPMERLPVAEQIGLCDFPSVWNQSKREGMWLHWDGNNNSVPERNRSASFGTGATPPTLDRESLQRRTDWDPATQPPERIEEWLWNAVPPRYPQERIDSSKLALGKQRYDQYCASCHGPSGTEFAFTPGGVGDVTDIAKIGTDRHRLDSYTEELCANQNLLYAGYPEERFRHFRKTNGYANQPLDGLWLRAPYLHNGSVPTLRELLDPGSKRRTQFYRGYDVFDHARVGFVADVAEEGERKFFLFDTTLPGNGNFGHEGPEYGTDLPEADKDALVEYLKTF